MPDKTVEREPRQIFIVDDHPVVRLGLKQLIGQDPNLNVCGEACSVEEATERIERANPDLVLVDLSLPGVNGLQLIRYIKQHWVGMKIIVVSTCDEAIYAPLARDEGADRYINKHEAMESIVQAIHEVMTEDLSTERHESGQHKSDWFG